MLFSQLKNSVEEEFCMKSQSVLIGPLRILYQNAVSSEFNPQSGGLGIAETQAICSLTTTSRALEEHLADAH